MKDLEKKRKEKNKTEAEIASNPEDGKPQSGNKETVIASTSRAARSASEEITQRIEKLKVNKEDKMKRLSGAARKRMNFLLRKGLNKEEARTKALDPEEKQKIADRKRQRSSERTPPEATPSKRQREGTAKDKPMTKKTYKPLAKPSFKDVLAGQKVAILAKDFPNTVLTTAQMDEIRNEIMDKVLEEEVTKPQFLNSTYKAGYLTLHCKNDATAEWIKKLALNLKPWATADLWAMEETKVPHPKIVVGYFPNAATVETERILSFVQRQNDGLRVEAWRMLRRANKKTNAMLVFSVDQISAAKLEEIKGWISFKFGQVQLHLKEAGGKDVEEEDPNDAASSSMESGPSEGDSTPINPATPTSEATK